MISEDISRKEEKKLNTLEEICENTRAIRRVANRILDLLHEYQDTQNDYDADTMNWKDFYHNEDVYY